MIPVYQYENLPDTLKSCSATRVVGDCAGGWMWFMRARTGKLEPVEVGPMSFDLLQLMLQYLENDAFLEDAERTALDSGAELLLMARWERSDRSVGISDGYELDVAYQDSALILRRVED